MDKSCLGYLHLLCRLFKGGGKERIDPQRRCKMAGAFRNSQKQCQVFCDTKGKEFGEKIGNRMSTKTGFRRGKVAEIDICDIITSVMRVWKSKNSYKYLL